ncbi:Cu_bind_like domain-containing protein [Cephalotus follicularis]|uniref:Cu_bind_like domain-containing protein n=1 Tax=Cephalotus follicularis TaxID=3775 RepID=A0A1Q3C428_CEPFO|nr:Cu_bind_like domain-containing protein [Cephalotus follicularis]
MAILLERAVALIMILSMVPLSYSSVYKVGESSGWTTIGNVDYKLWSATKTFHVGDTVVFEYNAQFHNVMRITHAMYKACNSSAPLATYTTGNDSIIITTHGHHFFFCGVPGHCQAGQKVDINVLRTSSVAPTPSPSVLPAAQVPRPSPNDAASLNAWKGVFFEVELIIMVVFASFLANVS